MSEATPTSRECAPQLTDPSVAIAELIELERQLDSLQTSCESPRAEPIADRLGPVGRSLLKLVKEKAVSKATPAGDSNSQQEVSAPTNAAAENRRALPRRRGKCRVTVACTENIIPSGAPEWEWKLATSDFQARLHDVSLKSVAFDLDAEIPVGRFVLLRIANQDTNVTIDAVGETVRVSPQPDTGFRIVCRLKTPLSIEEISNLGWTPFATDTV